MRVAVRTVSSREEEQVVLECVAMTPEFEDIQHYCLSRGGTLLGCDESAGQALIPFHDILYIEAVGKRVFAYTADRFYELRERLYEVEEKLRPHHFIRCSKGFLIGLLKVDSIRPALNGRYCARMKNGEEIIVSRKYAPLVRKAIMEEL